MGALKYSNGPTAVTYFPPLRCHCVSERHDGLEREVEVGVHEGGGLEEVTVHEGLFVNQANRKAGNKSIFFCKILFPQTIKDHTISAFFSSYVAISKIGHKQDFGLRHCTKGYADENYLSLCFHPSTKMRQPLSALEPQVDLSLVEEIDELST